MGFGNIFRSFFQIKPKRNIAKFKLQAVFERLFLILASNSKKLLPKKTFSKLDSFFEASNTSCVCTIARHHHKAFYINHFSLHPPTTYRKLNDQFPISRITHNKPVFIFLKHSNFGGVGLESLDA